MQQLVTERIEGAVNYLKLTKEVSQLSNSYARIQPSKVRIVADDFKVYQEASFRLTNIFAYNEVVVVLLAKGVTNLQVNTSPKQS